MEQQTWSGKPSRRSMRDRPDRATEEWLMLSCRCRLCRALLYDFRREDIALPFAVQQAFHHPLGRRPQKSILRLPRNHTEPKEQICEDRAVLSPDHARTDKRQRDIRPVSPIRPQPKLTIIPIRNIFLSMIVCICRRYREQDIRRAAQSELRSAPDIYRELGAGPNCGRCLEHAEELIRDVRLGLAAAGSTRATTSA